jgi:hypothetical protein
VRTRALAPLLLAAAVGAAPPVAAAEGPPTLRAKTAKTVVKATQGSFCWTDRSAGMCGDMAYPLPTEGALPWKPRAPLVFGTSFPVDSLSPCLSRVDGQQETPLNVCLVVQRGADDKWRGQMPKNLREANRLSIFVTQGHNDAHYSAAIAR